MAIPFGIYDLARDAGWVNVGVDHGDSAFAVASIRRWWAARGQLDYPQADRLLITADCGGSNSYRYRVWKAELAAFAADTGLAVTVCHFPPGTSKWNKIEHRLFSHITMNWRGRPLTSHEVVVNSIAATRTRAGLRVAAELGTRSYPVGNSVSRQQLAALPIRPHEHRGAWNYTIEPASAPQDARLEQGSRELARAQALAMLADFRLTGMAASELDMLRCQLASLQAAQAEQRKYHQRGGPRRKAKADHRRPLLSDADRVLITVIYLRQVCSQKVLAELLQINPNSIGQAITQTRKLLCEQRITLHPGHLAVPAPAAAAGLAGSRPSPEPDASQRHPVPFQPDRNEPRRLPGHDEPDRRVLCGRSRATPPSAPRRRPAARNPRRNVPAEDHRR